MASDEGRQGSIIERLPEELRLDLYDFLGYRDAIRLSQVNTFFYNTIIPQSWPANDKGAFIFQHQFIRKHNDVNRDVRGRVDTIVFISDGYACFSCYKVKPKGEFSKMQSRRQNIKWCSQTRFCLDCGVQNGMYEPKTPIRSATITRRYQQRRVGQVTDLVVKTFIVCVSCRSLCQCVELENPATCRSCSWISCDPDTRKNQARYEDGSTFRGLYARCEHCHGGRDVAVDLKSCSWWKLSMCTKCSSFIHVLDTPWRDASSPPRPFVQYSNTVVMRNMEADEKREARMMWEPDMFENLRGTDMLELLHDGR